TAVKTTISQPSASYSYTDITADMNQSTLYYRIKGTSADGSIKYTETKLLRTSEKQNVSISVFPNPTSSQVNISYTAEKNEQITIRSRNISGQQLMMENVGAATGLNTFAISEVHDFSPGVYFAEQISGSKIIITEKFVKQ